MPISVAMIVVSSQLVVAVTDRVPTFDISRSCRLDLAATAGLSVDQSQKSCVADEKRARQKLASQWSKFSAPSKAECIPQESIGGTPSYVSLMTCLQMGQQGSPSIWPGRRRGHSSEWADLSPPQVLVLDVESPYRPPAPSLPLATMTSNFTSNSADA
jgi:hypothetical protein